MGPEYPWTPLMIIYNSTEPCSEYKLLMETGPGPFSKPAAQANISTAATLLLCSPTVSSLDLSGEASAPTKWNLILANSCWNLLPSNHKPRLNSKKATRVASSGGKGDYSKIKDQMIVSDGFESRLFEVSNSTGYTFMKQVPAFRQEDLLTEDVYILDSFHEIFIWLGVKSNKFEKNGAYKDV